MGLNLVHRFITAPAEGQGTPITFAAATKMLLYTPPRPVRVVRWGAIVTTAPTGTGALKFTGDTFAGPNGTSTQVSGSTTNLQASGYNASTTPNFFVDTAGGSLTVPQTAIAAGSIPIGTFLWHNVNPQAAQTGGYYPAPETALIPPGGVDTQLVIYPGQSFQITCATVTGTVAGVGVIFLELEELALTMDFNNNPMVLSGYPSANGTVPTPSWPFPTAPFNGQS